MQRKGVLLMLLALWCQTQADDSVGDSTKSCESTLTKLDPHMSKYIGQK